MIIGNSLDPQHSAKRHWRVSFPIPRPKPPHRAPLPTRNPSDELRTARPTAAGNDQSAAGNSLGPIRLRRADQFMLTASAMLGQQNLDLRPTSRRPRRSRYVRVPRNAMRAIEVWLNYVQDHLQPSAELPPALARAAVPAMEPRRTNRVHHAGLESVIE